MPDGGARHGTEEAAGAAPAHRSAPSGSTTDPALCHAMQTLRDPAVRDLAWMLLGCDLLRAQPPAGLLAERFSDAAERARTLDWLAELDRDCAALHGALAKVRLTRLGRYAETLIGWFLQQGPAARLIAANVPLRRAGVTIGECDFLVETRDGRRLHWELAVKCYLHAGAMTSVQSASRLADYVGANLQDRFDWKMTRMTGHQLPLSARDELTALGYVGPWTPQMFVRGWLFYRDARWHEASPEIDAEHARGFWTTRSAWPTFAATNASASWRVLPRLEWLAPRWYPVDALAKLADAALCGPHTLLAQLAGRDAPTMVAGFVDDGAGGMREVARGFIVADEWPELAQAFASNLSARRTR